MSHHCPEEPATVADLVAALLLIDQSLPVFETWNEVPGWFTVDADCVWVGVQKCDDNNGRCRHER